MIANLYMIHSSGIGRRAMLLHGVTSMIRLTIENIKAFPVFSALDFIVLSWGKNVFQSLIYGGCGGCGVYALTIEQIRAFHFQTLSCVGT